MSTGPERKTGGKSGRWVFNGSLIVVPVVVLAAVLVLTKGDLPGLIDHIRHGEAYVGNSLSKDRIVIDGGPLLGQLISSPDFQDFRRRRPDFDAPLSRQLKSKTTPEEEDRYGAFLARFAAIKRDRSAVGDWQSIRRITRLVHEVYAENAVHGRVFDGAHLGQSKSHPEDYVYQLVNAKTACGTVGEATVALMRDAGYLARLVIVSERPDPVEANHVLSEVYAPDQRQWIMIDPMIDHTGVKSVFELFSDEALSSELSARHRTPELYDDDSIAWIDRRGFFRKILYYAPNEDVRSVARKSIR